MERRSCEFLLAIFFLANSIQRSVAKSLDFNIDPLNGRDTFGCGTSTSPCKSILFTWSVAKDEGEILSFNLSPGSYQSHGHAVLDLQCSGNTTHITMRGQEGRANATAIGISILTTKCSIKFQDVVFISNSSNIRHIYQFSNATFSKVMFLSTSISIHGEESSILISSTEIYNCTGILKDYPMFVIQAIDQCQTRLTIKNTTFAYNSVPFSLVENIYEVNLDTVYFMSNGYTSGHLKKKVNNIITIMRTNNLTMRHIRLIKNVNFTISLGQSKGIVEDLVAMKNTVAGEDNKCRKQQNHTIAGENAFLTIKKSSVVELWNSTFVENEQFGGGILVNVKEASNFSCIGCLFECNVVDEQTRQSPINFTVKPERIVIRSSFASTCPVLCHGGHYLKNKVLCLPCKKGMYLPPQSNISTTGCIKCPVGMYSDKQAAFRCKSCPANTFCSKTGCTKCSKCKNDFFGSATGSQSCNKPTILFLVLVVLTALLIFIPTMALLLQWTRKKGIAMECTAQKSFSPQSDKKKLIEKKLIINS